MKRYLCICMLVSVLFISGCWDRTEINDLAFITGSALDRTKNGNYLLTVQLAIPQSGQATGGNGGSQGKFFVLSAEAQNASDAFQMIQKKSSRRLFTAHRSVFFIGESLGRYGINKVLDVFAHDSRQRLRTYMMVVKGESAMNILKTNYPFEQLPMEAAKELEGLRTEMAVTLRDYFIAASSEGISPVLGAIETSSAPEGGKEGENNLFKLAGTAIFKGARVVGFLDGNETNAFIWAMNHMKNVRISATLPDGIGNVGIIMNRANRRISTTVKGDKVQVKFQLEGVGSLIENNTRLDISRPNNLKLVRKAFEQSVEKQVLQVVEKLQKQYKADSLGIGQTIYRDHPKQWKKLKKDWETIYPEVAVTVSVHLSIKGAGMSGPPLQFNEKEIIK